jgi:hypothetical protein
VPLLFVAEIFIRRFDGLDKGRDGGDLGRRGLTEDAETFRECVNRAALVDVEKRVMEVFRDLRSQSFNNSVGERVDADHVFAGDGGDLEVLELAKQGTGGTWRVFDN